MGNLWRNIVIYVMINISRNYEPLILPFMVYDYGPGGFLFEILWKYFGNCW